MSWSLRRVGIALSLLATAPLGASTTMGGEMEAIHVPPKAARVADYANAGYQMRLEDGTVSVSVNLEPLQSSASFHPLPLVPGLTPLGDLARRLTASEHTVYGAVSRILNWVAGNIHYVLDRDLPQAPAAVLRRRSAYCTGVARLSVASLRAVGIEAREVPGYVSESGKGLVSGYHRWIEVFYPDVGWVFSDPLRSHHFVPATYMRLDSELVAPSLVEPTARLLSFRDGSVPIDLAPGPPEVRIRRNRDVQRAAALLVRAPENSFDRVVLLGPDRRWSRALTEGSTVFLGLQPGRYTLSVQSDGRVEKRRFTLLEGERSLVELAAIAATAVGTGASRSPQ